MGGWKRRFAAGVFMGTALLINGCGSSEKTEEVHSFAIWEKTEETFYTFSDGVRAYKWKNEKEDGKQFRYRLEDGTDLLQTTCVLIPEETTDARLSGLDGLTEEAQKKVRAYYQKQGVVYDLDLELESAYQDYLECQENKERFTCHEVSQDVTQSAQMKQYMVILTAVTTPKKRHFDGGSSCRYESAVFDRTSGDVLEAEELFRVPKSEVAEVLSELCAQEDTTVSGADVAAVMEKGQILFFQDYLELWFPYGTWGKQEFDKGFGFEYEKVADLLHDWAIPEAETGE